MSTVLREFLKLELIQGIDDADYERLTKATERVQQRLEGNLEAVRKYSIALLDPELSDNDPTLDEIESDVEEEWITFRTNKFHTRPVALLRAVGIQGLVNFLDINKDFTASYIAWLSAITMLERRPMGTESEFLRKQYLEWGQVYGKNAEEEWQNAETFDPLEDIKLDKITYSKTESKAFGIAEGTATTPEIVAPVIEAAAKHVANGVLQTLTALKNTLSGTIDAGLKKIADSQRRRLSLLWWKQTLYSPSRQTSYRKIPSAAIRVFTLASDLQKSLPDIYPISVEYLLREVVSEVVTGEEDIAWSIPTFTEALMTDPEIKRALCQYGSGNRETYRGRVPLLWFLIAVAQGFASASEAPLYVGVLDTSYVNSSDMAVWLLREMTAEALVGAEG